MKECTYENIMPLLPRQDHISYIKYHDSLTPATSYDTDLILDIELL